MEKEKNCEELDANLQMDEGCVMITKAACNFSCNDVTMTKAMLIYHHYQKARNEPEVNLHQLFATAAFSLSVQISEENVQMEEIIEFFNKLGNFKGNISSMDRLKSNIKKVQREMYRFRFGPYKVAPSKSKSSNFDIGYSTAHRYVFNYMHQFSSMPDIQMDLSALKTWTLKYLNVFYHCPKCITYAPAEIAWAAITVACLEFHIDIGNHKILDKEMSAIGKINIQKAIDDIMLVVVSKNLSVSVK